MILWWYLLNCKCKMTTQKFCWLACSAQLSCCLKCSFAGVCQHHNWRCMCWKSFFLCLFGRKWNGAWRQNRVRKRGAVVSYSLISILREIYILLIECEGWQGILLVMVAGVWLETLLLPQRSHFLKTTCRPLTVTLRRFAVIFPDPSHLQTWGISFQAWPEAYVLLPQEKKSGKRSKSSFICAQGDSLKALRPDKKFTVTCCYILKRHWTKPCVDVWWLFVDKPQQAFPW